MKRKYRSTELTVVSRRRLLATRRTLVALSKMDTNPDPKRVAEIQEHFEKLGLETFLISSVTGDGIDGLIYGARAELEQAAAEAEAEVELETNP